MAQVGAKRAKEFAFLPGNSIDRATSFEWGWANHCVFANSLVEAVEALASRIALVPSEVLRVNKLSIHRAAEASGFRATTSGIAELDALCRLAPSVLAIRARIADQSVKAALEDYRGPSSTALINSFRE
ncbi:hypothetical protein [Novosphingobium sp. BL-52-GroH]|uniref:hypothetical protein n=1 Tax=Novosphingobium sp. BL-52-GroH TaxID=3349877 RepID=UPI00384BEC41